MAGIYLGLRIYPVHRVVHRDASFACAGGDELEFAGIAGDIARGVDARHVGGHHLIDFDIRLLRVEPPLLDRAKVRVKAEQGYDGVDAEGFLLLRLTVENGDPFHPILTLQCSNFPEGAEITFSAALQFLNLVDGCLVSSESISAVYQHDGLGYALEVHRPVER